MRDRLVAPQILGAAAARRFRILRLGRQFFPAAHPLARPTVPCSQKAPRRSPIVSASVAPNRLRRASCHRCPSARRGLQPGASDRTFRRVIRLAEGSPWTIFLYTNNRVREFESPCKDFLRILGLRSHDPLSRRHTWLTNSSSALRLLPFFLVHGRHYGIERDPHGCSRLARCDRHIRTESGSAVATRSRKRASAFASSQRRSRL